MRAVYQRFFVLVLMGFGGVGIAYADRSLPLPPSSYIYDEPHIFSSHATTSVRKLLSEHDRNTSEQILVAVFQSLEGEDLVSWTNQIFQHWKVGKKGKDNGILLAFYWKDRKIRIEVGYGLESLLTDAKSKRIISEIIVPRFKQNQSDEALVLSVLAILKTIQSPLVGSGEAEKILKEGGFQHLNSAHLQSKPSKTGFNDFWIILIIIIVIMIIHFFRRFPPSGGRPGGPSDWGGGWGPGPFGGGGSRGDSDQYSGGGGSSGGGGASGEW